MDKDAHRQLSENLKALGVGSPDLSLNSLAKKAGVAQTALGYMVSPENRPRNKTRPPSVTLENIQRVARALGIQTWELLYSGPTKAPKATEAALYKALDAHLTEIKRGR